MANENIVTITKENFEKEVINSEVPVLMDFWAQWCGPCRAVGPIMEELAEDFQGKVKIAKLNVDEQGEIAEKFRIMSIPTILLFKEGQVAGKLIGARPKEEFADLLTRNN